jgi:hypothetical protein
MKNVYDILLMTIPALIVFVTAWVLLRNLMKNDQDKRRQEIVLQNTKTIAPIRLHAYERLILFLERISLESLLVRVSSPDMTAAQLHSALLTSIRSEFEHNLSQQIYMSPQSWEVIRNARSSTIKMINTEFEKLPANAGGMALSQLLLQSVMQMDKEPTRVAIDFIKAEIAKFI